MNRRRWAWLTVAGFCLAIVSIAAFLPWHINRYYKHPVTQCLHGLMDQEGEIVFLDGSMIRGAFINLKWRFHFASFAYLPYLVHGTGPPADAYKSINVSMTRIHPSQVREIRLLQPEYRILWNRSE